VSRTRSDRRGRAVEQGERLRWRSAERADQQNTSRESTRDRPLDAAVREPPVIAVEAAARQLRVARHAERQRSAVPVEDDGITSRIGVGADSLRSLVELRAAPNEQLCAAGGDAAHQERLRCVHEVH
jgi:hypothetical protein